MESYIKDKLLKKWDPIIDSIIKPFELNNLVKQEISCFCEDFVNDRKNEYKGIDDGYKLKTILIEFKQQLLQNYNVNNEVVSSYYNRYLNSIVYLLDNDEMVTMNGNVFTPINTDKEVNDMINIFYNIADPIRVRKIKIQKINKIING